MAYKIQKNPHVREDVTVEDVDGRELTVSVDIDVHRIMQRYTGAAQKIGEAETELRRLQQEGIDQEKLGDAYAALGAAIVNLFLLVFGQEQTKRIIDFYDGRHTEMLQDFVPFLQDVVVPKIRDAQTALARKYTAKSWKR